LACTQAATASCSNWLVPRFLPLLRPPLSLPAHRGSTRCEH
jgi:hypothetical protein